MLLSKTKLYDWDHFHVAVFICHVLMCGASLCTLTLECSRFTVVKQRPTQSQFVVIYQVLTAVISR